jgi:uncharacterized membrane protein
MFQLLAAALSFTGLHLGVSGTAVRGFLIEQLGPRSYRALFSLGSFASLIWLARAYSHAYLTDNTVYWTLPYAQHIAAPVMGFALFLAVPGVVSRSPTALERASLLLLEPEPRGMQRITRHPFLWGVLLWATFHVSANGDAASIVLFSTFWLVAALGTRSIDRKRARQFGETWLQYRAQTSNVPFAAIASGRTRLVFREIGVWRLLLAVAVFCALVSVHPRLFHAYPLPGMGAGEMGNRLGSVASVASVDSWSAGQRSSGD